MSGNKTNFVPSESSANELSFIETTALIVAYHRSLEHARPDRLFDDPFAGAFVAAAQAEGMASDTMPAAPTDYFAVRTRFFDEYLLKACRAGCRQIVTLAAGLDARAFRLQLPREVRLFEVELATMLRFKESVLSTLRARRDCDRVLVPADLRDNWPAALVEAGFDTASPTAWLVEGLLFYLTNDDGDRLLERVTQLSAPGSWLGVEHVNRATLDAMGAVLSRLAQGGAPWQSFIENPDAWMARLGWVSRVSPHDELALRYGRSLQIGPFPQGEPPKAWLIEATRA
ncbi:SAM-dependent methyltransferase [Pendulispora brunnea]|uniref:S-adenosyl-L-methionine-dependent methyltransferase n=1 Tax=Pendulispora brunnea TaxID=2905690 RepID=A0ABZ2KQY6_9BACT